MITQDVSRLPVTNVLGVYQVPVEPAGLLSDPSVDVSPNVQSQLDLATSSWQPKLGEPFFQHPMSPEPSFAGVSGLFTPELNNLQANLYQQEQQRAMQAQAMQFAKLSPMEQAQYGLYYGGQQIGGIAGNALGAKDPQLQLISQRNAITSQIDMTDPDSLARAANLAVKTGDMQFANALADRYKALKEAQVKQLQEGSVAAKNLAETEKIKGETGSKQQAIKALQDTYKLDDATAIAVANSPDLLKTYLTPKSAQAFKLLETGKYTADSIGLWEIGKGVLEPIDKMAKPDGSFLSKAQELNIGVKAKFGDYTPEETGKINTALMKDQVDLASARATSIRISNNVQQEKAFSEKRGTTQAAELDGATNLARGASQALNTIRSMKQLNDSGQLFTGPVAQSYVGATNLLSSLNLLSPDQAKMLTSSQVYDKQAKDLVMNELAGKLGAGISEGDRKFIEDRIPQLTTSPAARKELLNKIESLQQDKIIYWKKMTAHANKYTNLNDFDFSENYSPIANNPPSGGGWSIKPKQ